MAREGSGSKKQPFLPCFNNNQQTKLHKMNDQAFPKSVSEVSAEFLKKDDVAALLSVSRRTIDCLLARGELPVIRFSKRRLRFPRQAVLDAMNRRVVGRR